jgi:hypothetical protein
MRVVLSWVSLGVDLDLYSIQYTKTTKAVCRCYYGGTCGYVKRKTYNDIVIEALSLKMLLQFFISLFFVFRILIFCISDVFYCCSSISIQVKILNLLKNTFLILVNLHLFTANCFCSTFKTILGIFNSASLHSINFRSTKCCPIAQ